MNTSQLPKNDVTVENVKPADTSSNPKDELVIRTNLKAGRHNVSRPVIRYIR